MSAKICYITAIYGAYEACCHKYVNQTIPSDFICFTDNALLTSNGWIIDTTPYHYTNKSQLDNDTYINSFCNNQHTFNIAKYYKQSWQAIPRLQQYDVVIWLDGTIEITSPNTSKFIIDNIHEHKLIGWQHESHATLAKETEMSNFYRYTSTQWNGQRQPYQNVNAQYSAYLRNGYNDRFFKDMEPTRPNFGMWVTCFVAFLNHDEDVTNFLNMWYLQTLQYTTQDQISFPYVCFKTRLIPLTLPNAVIKGDRPHTITDLYIKHNHAYRQIRDKSIRI